MAGSCGGIDDCKDCAFGGSHTWRSLMSLPRNMIYSKISSRGATGRSVGLSSVPNDLTEKKNEVIHDKSFQRSNMNQTYWVFFLHAHKSIF